MQGQRYSFIAFGKRFQNIEFLGTFFERHIFLLLLKNENFPGGVTLTSMYLFKTNHKDTRANSNVFY